MTDDQKLPGRGARTLVLAALALLVVPGLVGFDAWPLTAWRLFSLSRDGDQTRWVIEAVSAEGTRRVVSLEELPLRYRNAEWQMAELPKASDNRRDGVCEALADAVVNVEPSTHQLAISRDRQALEKQGGEWVTTHDLELIHTCSPTERQ